VSTIITIFSQAFRYAAEPFFFAQQKEANAQDVYSNVMNYFIIAASTIFLVIMLYLDLVMLFVGKDFRIGVAVVPILLMANICLGIFFNLSIWYKLTGKTMYGAFIALFGATITIVLNYLWIPKLGYLGSAWATLACYLSMSTLSYLIGQRHYPINYNVLKGVGYPLSVLFLYYISTLISPTTEVSHFFINGLILLVFTGVVYLIEKPRNLSN
jgi:O-antigen/teichoic acid export membrane protein